MSNLDQKQIHKILNRAQTGDLSDFIHLKTNNRDFHWSSVSYPETGETVLHGAARLGHINSINYLLTYTPSGINCKNKDDKTALHEATQFSQLQTVRVLLEKGADVNALKRGDWTPLMLACTKNSVEIVQELLENGAVVNVRNRDGWSALHLVGRTGNLGIFELLVQNGAQVEAVTNNGRGVLHIAALHNNLNIIKFVLMKYNNFNSNLEDNCGNTPLCEGILAGNFELCEFLLKCGGIINKKLLFLVARQGKIDRMNFLITQSLCDVNFVDLNNSNALHCAAKNQQKQMCHLLVQLGCQQDLKDIYGKIPLDYFQY